MAYTTDMDSEEDMQRLAYGSPLANSLDRIEATATSQDFRFQIYGPDILKAYSAAFPGVDDAATFVALLLQESSLRRFHSIGDAAPDLARGIGQYKGVELGHIVNLPRMLDTIINHLKAKGWDGTSRTIREAYGRYGFGDTGYRREIAAGGERLNRILALLISKRARFATQYVSSANPLYCTRGVPQWFDASMMLSGYASASRLLVTKAAWRAARTAAARSNGRDKVNPAQPIARLLMSKTRIAFPGGSTGIHRDAARQVVVPAGRSLGGHNGGVAVDIAADATSNRPRAARLVRQLVKHAHLLGIVMVQFSKLRWSAAETVWTSVDDNDHFNHIHTEVQAGPVIPGSEELLDRIIDELE